MATNSLYSVQQHHHHHSLIKRRLLFPSDTLFLTPPTTNATISLSHSSFSVTTLSLSPATSSTPSTSEAISFELLRHHLSAQNFRQADEETRRLLIVLAGESSQKRGYVFFSEVQFISETDLKTIDELWRQHSGNKFGYSVQKRIFEKLNKDFTKFFIKVRWMKKLDTEVEQYNYRSFPTEFMWELNDDVPEGHLPLTNALRGTRLLNNILNHPAFEAVEKEEGDETGVDEQNGTLPAVGFKDNSNMPIFKPDYSF